MPDFFAGKRVPVSDGSAGLFFSAQRHADKSRELWRAGVQAWMSGQLCCDYCISFNNRKRLGLRVMQEVPATVDPDR